MCSPMAPCPNAPAGQLEETRGELQRQLQSGQACRVEDWLTAHPELVADPQAVLDLIYEEYATRLELQQEELAREFYARFPQWRSALRRQFHFHCWVSETLGGDSLHRPRTLGADPCGPESPHAGPGDLTSAFEIQGEIGRGGMGVVYRAWQKDLNRPVALKVSRAEGDGAARLQAEAQAVARLQHPNIVQVYGIGQQDGGAYLVLELVDGGTLAGRLEEGPLPAREAAALLGTLARAVHHAHERGVVHRDLTPANILFTRDGVPKVADFGLARLQSDRAATRARAGWLLGTPNYMPPEQVAGEEKRVGPAGDIYSLGAILYEALTGRLPFQGKSLLETLRLVLTQMPVPPRQLDPGIPDPLEAICLRCLAKAPRRRYPTAAELAGALEEVAEARAAAAGPVRPIPRRRRRRAACAVGIGKRPDGKNDRLPPECSGPAATVNGFP
jgi:serine/threonine protein kinase